MSEKILMQNDNVGIDLSEIINFSLINLNTSIIDRVIDGDSIGKRRNVELVVDSDSPFKCDNGKGVGRLTIKDSNVGYFEIKYVLNKDSTYICKSKLIMKNSNGHNLKNLNAAEFKERVRQVFDYIENQYGIQVCFSKAEISKIELNYNIQLSEDYTNYRQAMLLIFSNLPKTYRKSTNCMKYNAWYEQSVDGRNLLEDLNAGNKSTKIKLYIKSKQLKDKGYSIDENDNILRLEYTFCDKRVLQHNFGTIYVDDITNEMIVNLFRKRIKNDILKQYNIWTNKNHNELNKKVKEIKLKNIRWSDKFIRMCREYAQVYSSPLLFSIEDMNSVLKEIDTNRNGAKKYTKFYNRAVFEHDLIGNRKRIEEIIHALNSI